MTSAPAAAAPRARRRGRESVGDMVRSLGIVMVLVVGLWFFGQASPSDSHRVRAVDASTQLSDFRANHPGVPAPGAAPAGWTPNTAAYDGQTLRIGYVVDRTSYVEFAAGTGPVFVAAQDGRAARVGTIDVGGVTWTSVRSPDGHASLERVVGTTTLVVGGVRAAASPAQLAALAAVVR